MNPTETRKLGKSGVSLTQLGSRRTAPLGELFVRVDEADRRRFAAGGLGCGRAGISIRPPGNGRGLSEIRNGRFLDSRSLGPSLCCRAKSAAGFFRPSSRTRFRPARFGRAALRFDHVHDYSYDGIMRSYEQSQMRLGLNRIDLAAHPRSRFLVSHNRS